MKIFNYLFYILLFIGFFLPTNNNFYIPLPGVLLKVNELAFLLLPIVNVLCVSKGSVRFIDKKLSNRIIIFIGIILFTEFVVKRLYFGQGFGDAFKTIRMGMPLFSSLVLILQGIRVDIKVVWKVLLVAISSSVILSLISLIIPLPIYYDLESGADLLKENQGRVMNSNASFGVIGLYLLFENKDKWYNQGRLVRITAILSLIALVIGFNRTYLAILTLEGCYLVYKNFSVKQIVRGIFIAGMFFGVGLYAYFNNTIIQRQIDKRILSIVFQETTIAESTISDNRDGIYANIEERLEEGYWVIGLPYKVAIFEGYSPKKGRYKATKTDISLINLLLRYGILPLIIFIFIIWRLRYHTFRLALFLYALASLNIDSLYGHNSIFFIIIITFLIHYEPSKSIKYNLYSSS